MRLLNVTPVDYANQLIKTHLHPLTSWETIPLAIAGGRILSSPIFAAEDVPGFHRSTVDGYALRAQETNNARENSGTTFHLSGEVGMGMTAPNILPGECCYVPTGGMLPRGADAVVMIEYTEIDKENIEVLRTVAPGENCLFRGEDLHQEELVFDKGIRLRAPEIGVLASLGIIEVDVMHRPRVAIFSSGDELVSPDTANLSLGQIRDANGLALKYLAEQFGADAVYHGILPDQPHIFEASLRSSLDEADGVAISGGSSVGNRDFTPEILKKLAGGNLLFEGLAIQPGKPTLLGISNGKALLGLPGHPISALTVFSIIGKAIIQRLSGECGRNDEPYLSAILTRNIPSRPGRVELVRVTLKRQDDTFTATPIFGRSGLLHSMARADGVVEIQANSDGLMAGETVMVYPWR